VTDINANAIFTITVNPLPVITFTASQLYGCAPLVTTLSGTSDGANDVFHWSDATGGTNNPTIITLSDSGKYTISVLVTNTLTGCSTLLTKTDYITVYPLPDASFYPTPQSASILEPTIYFTNTSQGAISYEWNFGDPASGSSLNNSIQVDPSHYYDHTGEYYVHLFATTDKGCRDEALVKVEITPDFALYIPNTFTPDGNSLNDIFQPAGVGIDENNYKLEIFDRWGESIFSSDSFRKGWDGSVKGGKQAPQGVYIYKIMVYDLQGGKHPYVGHVTVIRKDN
jgi:gliding motility-associated-like protein